MTAAVPHGAVGARVWLRGLAVRDFRNLRRVNLELPPEGIAVVGDNGHGKTNLLESIYYLQLLRSGRSARDTELVRFGAEGFHLAAHAVDAPAHEVSVGFERATRRKRVRLDGVEIARLSEAIGALPSVMFSPRDVELAAGSPSARRRYLDITLALSSRRYLSALQQYRAALARRNAALRAAAPGAGSSQRVAVWEPALAKHGAVLLLERRAWVEEAAPRFAELCAAIGEREPVELRYAGGVEPGDDAEAALRAALEEKRPLDLRRGLTHAGPHRDELRLRLSGRELRSYGSAGQQRTASIALRLLEAETLRRSRRSEPLLLLDDPFAELDGRRAARILDLIAGTTLGQVILAVPRDSEIPPEFTRLERWRVADGAMARLAV